MSLSELIERVEKAERNYDDAAAELSEARRAYSKALRDEFERLCAVESRALHSKEQAE